MHSRTPCVAFVLLLMPLQSAIAADPVCTPLRTFVESVQPKDSKTLDFRTSWGRDFKDATPDPGEIVLGAKRCEHHDDALAKAACDVLMDEFVIEFAGENFKRVVECLSRKTRFGDRLMVDYGAVSLTYGNDDDGAIVTIAFDDDEKVGGMLLKIATDGY